MRLVNAAQLVILLPRWTKRLLLISLDVVLCLLAVWIAFFLRLNAWAPLYGPPAPAALGSLLLAFPSFFALGVYRPVFRHADTTGVSQILTASLAYTSAYFAVFSLWGVPGVPRTVGIIQPVLLFVFMVMTRIVARHLLAELLDRGAGSHPRVRVLIYGAGESGRQVASVLAGRREMKVVGFIDDARGLQGASLNGVRVHAPAHISTLIAKLGVTEILLAVPNATQHRRNEILAALRPLQVRVRTLPDFVELALGNRLNDDITNLDINDLLGREVVAPDADVIARHLNGNTILVTGAGGSIGSELCRQIIAANPARLLLFDSSEYALYTVHRELELTLAARRAADERAAPVELVALLGSIQDELRMDGILACWQPSHVYHAAAYKHVPLVEHNPVQGVANNVFGTLTVARQCIRHRVRYFVLVSTDKAVRPTNVMGATKRMAEMVLQALADEKSDTCLSMVRFGNVLGSSGSVVPLFRQQIRNGGPVTITDERITRFFMTIPEAAQLVLQAGAMARGGEMFVLDMGEPVRIVDLARNLIELSGLSVRDACNPQGDIELQFVGLRPGEKLYEELLIEDAPLATDHPRIRKASEVFLAIRDLEPHLARLHSAITRQDSMDTRNLLRAIVTEYDPSSALVDSIYLETTKHRGIGISSCEDIVNKVLSPMDAY
ncbi:polysaccharide biosynthesis protein [Sphingomonas sp.]|uniref:polysaccharide biosynthesis protein n=1 Tax=Sphingomonas sp. TaxID=28214 RepID=UPI003B008225